nr:GTP-binding protein like [Tanacetum cinerariifolium]
MISLKHVKGAKWLPFVIGIPPLLMFSAGSAAFGGYGLPNFTQLSVTSYYICCLKCLALWKHAKLPPKVPRQSMSFYLKSTRLQLPTFSIVSPNALYTLHNASSLQVSSTVNSSSSIGAAWAIFTFNYVYTQQSSIMYYMDMHAVQPSRFRLLLALLELPSSAFSLSSTALSLPFSNSDELTLAQTLIEIKAAKPKAITVAAIIVTAAGTRPKRKEIEVSSPSSEIPNEEGVPTTSNNPLPSEITLFDDTQGRINEEDMFRVNDLDGKITVVILVRDRCPRRKVMAAIDQSTILTYLGNKVFKIQYIHFSGQRKVDTAWIVAMRGWSLDILLEKFGWDGVLVYKCFVSFLTSVSGTYVFSRYADQ